MAVRDVYSCDDFNEDTVITFLSEMEPTKIEFVVIDRKDSLTIHHLLGPESAPHHHPLTPQIDPLGLLH